MRRHKTRPTTPKKAELVEELNTLRRQLARLQSGERKRKATEAERERAEAALARYKHIVAGTTDFMAFIDRNYRYQQINPSYLHAFGKKWEEIVGNTGEQLFGTHVFETVLKPRQDRCFSGQEVSYETWLDFPVRGRRYLDVHYDPFREPDGAISGIVVSARDITERKQAEEQLRTAQAHLQHLITSSPAVIYSCKPSGDYGASFITENIRSQLGYEAREFIEDPRFWADHIHPDDAPRMFAELPRIFEQGHYCHEYRFLCKDGIYRWMFDDMVLVRDSAGNPLEIVGYWIDITARKQAEAGLQASEQRLRQLLEDREQLYEDLHDGILQSLFAVGLTLSATKQLVERAPERAVTQIEESIVQLKEVMQEIRAFITDAVPPRLRKQDFKTALASLVSSLGSTPPLEIQVAVDDAAADCLTDAERLHLLNIAQEALSNSVRHSGGHHGRVSLRREGKAIRFEVEDDGVGFCVSSPKAERHGLHNMSSRAEKIGARLELHSNPGKGTQIVISLPKEA